MKKLFLLCFVTLVLSSFSFAGDIKWYSWKEGVELAGKENKPMLIFIYATWCHVCKKMTDKTFRSDDVAALANRDFIPVRLDIDLDETYEYREKQYKGKELLAKLATGNMLGIPSVLFYFPEQDKKYLEAGYKTAEEFIAVLTRYAEMKPE